MNRRFLGWDRPILHSAAEALLADAPAVGAVELRDVTVVLPGARAGRRLTECLLERTEETGRPLRPPRIVQVGGLPELFYRPAAPPPPPALERAAWTRALESVGKRALLGLFPSLSEEGETGVGLAGKLRKLQDDVGGAGHDFRSVAQVCRSLHHFSDEERWTLLAEVQQRFRDLLERYGYLDREAARRAALASGLLPPEGRIIVVGAPDLLPIVRAFLEAATPSGGIEIWIGAPEWASEGFDGRGCVRPGWWGEQRSGVPDRALRLVNGAEEQAGTLVEALHGLGGRFAAEEITIGVPDPGVFPFLIERLEEAGVPVRDARGRAIERTAPYRLLRAVADAVEAGEFDRFAALLRHPDFEGWLHRARPELPGSLPRLADPYRRIHLPFLLPERGALPSKGEEYEGPLARRMEAVRDEVGALLAPLRRTAPLSQWGERITKLLLDLEGEEPVHRHTDRGRELLGFAAALRTIQEGLAQLPGELDLPLRGDRAIRLLLDEMRGGAVPAEESAGAIELLGWLELAFDDAPVLYLTGANEPHLPESVTADPFLPHALRQALGMLDNEGRRARDLYLLRVLFETREEVLVTAARRDAEGTPLRLSRLLLAEAAPTVAKRMRAFLVPAGAEEGGDGTSREGEGAEPARGEGRSPFHLPPDPVISAVAPPDELFVTAFRQILEDPYAYALRRILKLESEDDQARELDPLGFGTLAHDILADFGKSPAAASDDGESIAVALEEILRDQARARYGSRPLPAVRLQVEQLRLRLHSFATWQAAWSGGGWRIAAVEAAPTARVAFPVDDLPFFLRGKLDRVDRNERTGEWIVFDYKTGDVAQDPEKAHRKGRSGAKRWVDLQLPLYHHLAPALPALGGGGLSIENPGALRVGYIVLPRDPTQTGDRIAGWTETDLEEADEVARSVVRTLRENRFVYDPRGSSIHREDPLAAVVGGGVLRLADDGEGEDGLL